MKTLMTLVTVGCLAFSCSQGEQSSGDKEQGPDAALAKGQSTVDDPDSAPNILRVAINSPDHTTLVTASQAAEMEDVLSNNGPLTVFAPTNAAFDALPDGTVETLLKPENKAKLKRVITHHAAPGTYRTKDLREGMSLYQASGYYLKVTRQGDDVIVGGAKILGSAEASNGVVHIVDTVLLPPEE